MPKLNSRIEIYFKEKNAWIKGTVDDKKRGERGEVLHHVEFDDETCEWYDLKAQKWGFEMVHSVIHPQERWNQPSRQRSKLRVKHVLEPVQEPLPEVDETIEVYSAEANRWRRATVIHINEENGDFLHRLTFEDRNVAGEYKRLRGDGAESWRRLRPVVFQNKVQNLYSGTPATTFRYVQKSVTPRSQDELPYVSPRAKRWPAFDVKTATSPRVASTEGELQMVPCTQSNRRHLFC